MTTTTASGHRPASPWSGSRHEDRHRWQLEDAGSLDEACLRLRALSAELTAAAAAGWRLVEPVRRGLVIAVRPSRRERGRGAAPPVATDGAAPALPARWRLRLVEEPATPVDDVLDLRGTAAARTPVLAVVDRALRQCGGPPLPNDVLEQVNAQVTAEDIGDRRWGVAPARVGPTMDLVADGSALRLHALHDGALVRRIEVLAFHHAADRALTLPAAAAAYERLALAVEVMAAAGGTLTSVEDGLLHVTYPVNRA